MDYTAWYKPHTLEEVIKDLQSHIPQDNEETERDALTLRRHQDRYRRFRLEDD